MKDIDRQADRLMSAQHSLITISQCRDLGFTRRQVAGRLASGRWRSYHHGVFAPAGAAGGPETVLMAACLAAGPWAAASHLSAAWLMGLVERPPGRPAVVVPYACRPRLDRVDVHRSRDLDSRRVLVRRGIPYTDALRCLCDLAAKLDRSELDPLIDRAVAVRLVTPDGLIDETDRRSRSGRSGPGQLRAALRARGLTGGPAPSVLEAEVMRLFRRFGIPVLGREVRAGADGRFRIDFLIAPGLAVEVDGFAYHWSPEAKGYDDARRNQLRLSGITVLVYSWRDIRFDARRVASEIRAAVQAAP